MESSKETDLRALTELIELLDSYRVHRHVDISSIDIALEKGELKGEIASQWKKIRPTLVKMASSTASIPGIIKLVKIRDSINFVSLVALTSAFALVAVRVLLRNFPSSSFGLLEELIFPSTLILVFVTLISRVVINRKIGLKIEEFYREKSKEFSNDYLRLKRLAQNFINILYVHLKRVHSEPKNYIMRLYNCDYKKIKVIKSPDRLKKYYTVMLESEQ
jgi:hypothetical protein